MQKFDLEVQVTFVERDEFGRYTGDRLRIEQTMEISSLNFRSASSDPGRLPRSQRGVESDQGRARRRGGEGEGRGRPGRSGLHESQHLEKMADIEERAEKWARERHAKDTTGPCDSTTCEFIRGLMVEAYLAGSEQAQTDCAEHLCGRCVCTCGAR